MPVLRGEALLSLQATDEEEAMVRRISDSSGDTGTPSGTCSDRASEEDEDSSLPPVAHHKSADITVGVPSLLERMNEASNRMNFLAREAGNAEARYGRRVLRYAEIYRGMRSEYGCTFDECKPLCKDGRNLEALRARLGSSAVEKLARCYRTLEHHQTALTKEQQLMDKLSQKVRAAKQRYASTMNELEEISNRVHEMRRKR